MINIVCYFVIKSQLSLVHLSSIFKVEQMLVLIQFCHCHCAAIYREQKLFKVIYVSSFYNVWVFHKLDGFIDELQALFLDEFFGELTQNFIHKLHP